jgi:hypothetical protein
MGEIEKILHDLSMEKEAWLRTKEEQASLSAEEDANMKAAEEEKVWLMAE